MAPSTAGEPTIQFLSPVFAHQMNELLSEEIGHFDRWFLPNEHEHLLLCFAQA